MFYKVEDGFYINAEKIASIEFLDNDFADISFSGNGVDEAISCELAKQIMDDMGCSGFNPYDVFPNTCPNEETVDFNGIGFECDGTERPNETVSESDRVKTFFELAKHAYALGFRYATNLDVKEDGKYIATFWENEPFYNEREKIYEFNSGNAITIPTNVKVFGIVDLEQYLEMGNEFCLTNN